MSSPPSSSPPPFAPIILIKNTGAPVDIASRADSFALAANPQQNNAFSFTDNDSDPSNPHSRCPFASHIRKTNPRGDLTSLPGSANSLRFERILRRGIQYGEEVEDGEKASRVTRRDRGLLFVAYQSHISRGFDLMQRSKYSSFFTSTFLFLGLSSFSFRRPSPNTHPP